MSETKDKNSIDDYFLKLTGKAALPEPLEIGYNYRIEIQGSITEKKERDREDGGRIYTWIFEPVIVELIDKKGRRIKAKDPRSNSRLWRSLLWAKWKEDNHDLDDEEFYNLICNWERRNVDEICERALREK